MNHNYTVTIFEEEYEIKPEHCALPDEAANGDTKVLNQAFVDHAANITWYGFLQSDAKTQVAQLNHTLEILTAELDSRIREEALEGGKKITEKAIDAQIKADTDYIETKDAIRDAEQTELRLRSLVSAFSHRKDAMITISANLRAEMAVTAQ